MKKTVIAISLILVVFVLVYFAYTFLANKNTHKSDQNSEGSFELSPYEITPTPNGTFEPSENASYKVTWLIVRDIEKIELFSNLEEKLTSSEAQDVKFCDHLVSASFYAENGGHIGLFVSDGNKLTSSEVNDTFNGYFYIDQSEKAFISYQEPQNPKIAIQTGPIIMSNNVPEQLSLERDENARRIIASVNTKGEVIFIAIYDKSNTLSGPKLSELGDILKDINQNTALGLKDAVNLDGGTHSAFVSNITKLTEVSLLGSYFCIKP